MYVVLNLGLKLANANFQPFLLTSAIAPFLTKGCFNRKQSIFLG
jgi:hypothetical protein